MASLGELTAGIALRFQNPLNLWNNFLGIEHEELVERSQRGTSQRWSRRGQSYLNDLGEIRKDQRTTQASRRLIRPKAMLEQYRKIQVRSAPDLNALADDIWDFSYHGWEHQINPSCDLKTEFELVCQGQCCFKIVGRVIFESESIMPSMQSKARPKAIKFQGGNEGMITPKVLSITAEVWTRRRRRCRNLHSRTTVVPAPSHQEKIFQPFFTTNLREGGTGHRLSLSAMIHQSSWWGFTGEKYWGKGNGDDFLLCQ